MLLEKKFEQKSSEPIVLLVDEVLFIFIIRNKNKI
jgi:hypothetical protein